MFSAYGIRIPTNEKLRVSDGYNRLTGLKDYLSVFHFHFPHSHKLVQN